MTKLTQQNLNMSIQEDHVFDEIGEMHEQERPPESLKQIMDFTGAHANFETGQKPAGADKKDDAAGDDSQEEHEGENSDGEEFINFFDRDEIESTYQW